MTTINLNDRVALVTGAAGGIGAAVARALAGAGATVVVTDLESQAARAQAVLAEIAAGGGRAEFIALDVGDERHWRDAMATVERHHAGLDVLVNNAGVVLVKQLEEVSLDELHWISRINIEGTFLGIRSALPLMKQRAACRTTGGSIVNLSSAMGIKGYPFGSLYSMTKGAIRLLSKSLALEFAQLGYNIRVNSLHPGLVDTTMVVRETEKLSQLGVMGTSTAQEMRQAFERLNPLGRLGTAQEIANAVLFLASDLSTFVNGAEMTVDGGETAQ